MSYKRKLVRLLDRPGGRTLLAKLGTYVAGKSGGRGVEVLYRNGFWMHCAGLHFFPDSPKFDYVYQDFSHWPHQMDRYIADAKEYWLRTYRPKEGDIIVDVGAGRGEDTVAFSKAVGNTGRVISIEAHPSSFEILKRFCQLNGLANVTALNLALMDKPGAVRINTCEESWMMNTVDLNNGSTAAEVRSATLKEVCDELDVERIAYLKMNIEGAERYALAGMSSVMPRIERICVACHDFRAALGHGEQFRTRAFVEQFLAHHGFALASRSEDPRDYVRDHVFGCSSRIA